MKDFFNSLLITSSLFLLISACTPTTNNSTPTSTSTPNPIVSPTPINSVNSSSKAAVIAVYKCVKGNAPDLALAMDAYISNLEAMTDANWSRDSAAIIKGLPRLEAYGCKL